jgi:hypothetical protein
MLGLGDKMRADLRDLMLDTSTSACAWAPVALANLGFCGVWVVTGRWAVRGHGVWNLRTRHCRSSAVHVHLVKPAPTSGPPSVPHRDCSEPFSVVEDTHLTSLRAEKLTFWSTCSCHTAARDAGGAPSPHLEP